MKSRTILITGATDGIGLALAHRYRQQAAQLILVGRRPWAEVPLTDFSSEVYCQADLSQPECASLIQNHLHHRQIERLDLLIHNAGLGYYGPPAAQSLDSIDTLVTVNLWAPVALTHTLLPHLRRAGGQVVFISSVVSALPGPEYAVYGATKAAIDGLARNLRIELRGSVAVQVIHPGATRSGMHAKSGMPKTVADWEKFPPAEQVAEQIVQAIDSRRPAVTLGLTNRLLRWSGRHLAGPLDWLLRRRYR